MIAPNGDQPTPHRLTQQPRAITLAHPLQHTERALDEQLHADYGRDIELSLLYFIVGGTILLLLLALMWTLYA